MKQTYSWSAPSNIAFVKYWGKKGVQEPVNSNLSGTLDSCRTNTSVEFVPGEFDLNLYFHGKRNESFEEKVSNKIKNVLSKTFSQVLNYSITINSENTFPHSCGIASSASFYASLGLCLAEFEFNFLEKEIKSNNSFSKEFLRRASCFARLGSGSAARSIYSGVATWDHTNPDTAEPFKDIHVKFDGLDDFICIIDSSEKSVSSTLGHSLMDNHPYKEARIEQANLNYESCIQALTAGDWESFIDILEDEANSLHALMMTSSPSFILLKPNTIALIDAFKEWRSHKMINAGYTIDAGPNLHFIVDRNDSEHFKKFIDTNIHLLENGKYIHDQIGGEIKQIEHF